MSKKNDKKVGDELRATSQEQKSARPVANRPEGDSGIGEVAAREEAVLRFWNEQNIFKQSLEKDAPNGDFVFYDGPPFATGLPHYGHILASTIKDAVPRFWTMNGYRVRRQWGWDCHGLPLENLIEKKLGLATKRDIEEYGIQNFNEQARETVLEYADDWRQIIPRMGRWADMENDYKTMDSSYTESVWWVFKSLYEKGLVYEGFKSMHLCPRCGTTLSNFEVNLGYKDIKDIAVTVKLLLLDEAGEPTDTSLLVWTTTPWTLPGNLAAAVHEEYDYVKVKIWTSDVHTSEEYVILAKARLSQLATEDYEIVEEMKGADLVGRSYEPPFPFLEGQDMEGKDNAWKIYHAPYVELGEEGTGAVHLAPAYGEEDMELAKEKGIPIFHHVTSEGHFKDFVEGLAGQLVKPKDDPASEISHLDADIEIVRRLKEANKLFRKENITHSYPHCWRCDTPLLNYATTSWFIEVTKFKDQLVAANNNVHWVPEHVGKNRFGKWLEGARDWSVSRQRYWGAPLPIWRNPDTKEIKVFGSLAELEEYIPKSGNTYYLMRHGESTKNTTRVVTNKFDAPFPLTEQGKKDVRAAAAEHRGQFDMILTSPVMRARETAELMAAELGIRAEQIIVDERLRETEHGVFEGRPIDEFKASYPAGMTRFLEKPEGGETWTDLRRRGGEFIYSLENIYQNKRILIVSHGDPMAMLKAAAAGMSNENTVATYKDSYPKKGVVQKLDFVPMPHNDNYELDFHRPYIDQVELYEGDTKLERVADVFDCWFESGSMPYAQHHYPFEHQDEFERQLFPANFIAEGLDQTRGWFYSLIVLGTALFGKSPYENVIVNGLVLAEDGRKMSKSLQNYPDPMELVARQGADAMRFYLLSSPIIKGEDLNFSEKEVQELQRKNIGRLHNVLAMYKQYAGEEAARDDSEQVLDRWVLARLNQVVAEITVGYKTYELDRATRPITDFIDDLSVWYLRRSRDRLKNDDQGDKEAALGTLRFVLQQLAQVMAPAMPFYADYLWREVRAESDPESVHLTTWPEAKEIDVALITHMASVRDVVSTILEVRAKANVKVRQPLGTVTLSKECVFSDNAEIVPLIKDEVNVKEVTFAEQPLDTVKLDTTLTPQLKTEGEAREFMRAVQDMRKQQGLNPNDRITLLIQTSDSGQTMIEQFRDMIAKTVGADSIAFGDAEGEELMTGEHSFTVQLDKKV